MSREALPDAFDRHDRFLLSHRMTGAAQADSRQAWARLGVSLAIATVGNVGMWAIVVVMPAVQAEFGIARADASLPYTLTMLGFALGNLAIGRAVDRYGVHRAMAGAALLIGASTALAAASPSILVLSALQCVIGFGTAASFGPLIADISRWFRRRRGIAVAIVACGNYLAGAVWPLLMAGVLETMGWRTVYLVLAAATVVTVLPLAMMLRTPPPDEAAAPAPGGAALPAAPVPAFAPRTLMWLLGLAGVGCCVAMSMPQVHIVALCVDMGFGPAVGAEMLSLMLLGGIVSRLVSGMVIDRLGGVRTVLIGVTLQAVALALYLPTDGMASLYVVSLVFGLAQGGIVPGYAIIVREYLPAREAGARVGFVMMATILGMALGGWMSGAIFDATGSYRMAFVNGIVWNTMTIAVLALIFLRGRARLRAAQAA